MVEYALEYCSRRLARRVRGKLKAAGITIIDEEDVFTSLGRRLMMRCEESGLVFSDRGQLDAYLSNAAINLVREKIRSERGRSETLQGYWRHSSLSNGTGRTVEIDLEPLLANLSDADRAMLERRLNGLSHIQMAEAVEAPLKTHRERWRRFVARIKAMLPPVFTTSDTSPSASTGR
jgi:DNA-directed RNA polymerase specialized sigma24 family protein